MESDSQMLNEVHELIADKHYDRALEKLSSLKPSLEGQILQGEAYFHSSRFAESERVLSEALSVHVSNNSKPKDSLLFRLLETRALSRRKQRQEHEAQEDFDLLIKSLSDPDLQVEAREKKVVLFGAPLEDSDRQRLEFLHRYRANSAVHLSDQWYVISNSWFEKWQCFVQLLNSSRYDDLPFNTQPVRSISSEVPSTIDNNDIIDLEQSKAVLYDSERPSYKFRLRRGLVENKDFVLLPEPCFKLLSGIYGCDTAIQRQAIEVNDTMYQVEVFLRAVKITSNQSQIDVHIMQVSRKDLIKTVKNKYLALKNARNQFRTWRVKMAFISLERLQALANTGELVYLEGGTILDENLYIDDAEMAEDDILLLERSVRGQFLFSEDSSVAIDRCSFCQKQSSLQTSCKKCHYVKYCSPLCRKRHFEEHKNKCKPISNRGLRLCFCKHSTKVDDYTDDNIPVTLRMTPQSRMGIVGLQNLGNTCFMNAALQCLSNTKSLTEFFLREDLNSVLNKTNPLGTSGKLALAFAEVIENLWRGTASVFTPSKLKKIISTLAPQFVGFQQHDSHELLCYLLDGLHEDLNRVLQKPYYEDNDSLGNSEQAAAEMWNRYLSRNDSVIVDLMHGQYKSTIYCPLCKEYCYSYDPFSSVSLPLPQEQEVLQNLYYIYHDSKQTPLSISCRLPQKSTLKDLTNYLREEPRFSSKNFTYVGICNDSVKETLEERKLLESLNSVTLFAFETEKSYDTIMEIRVFRDASKYKPTAYPRLVFMEKTDTFKNLHIEIFKQFQRYMPTRNDYEHFLSRASYKIKFYSSKIHPCSFCKDSSCKGCPVPYSSNSLAYICEEKLVTIDLVFTNAASVAFGEMNKCTDWERSRTSSRKSNTVELLDCFDLFQVPEELDNENTWYCSRCKKHVKAIKKLQIFKAPRILVLHLKRFRTNYYFREKLMLPVVFKEKGLDISSYVLGHNPPLYDLYGVINHFGALGGGHYTAICKNPESGAWVDFNDNALNKVSSFSTSAAYVLFYQARN